MGQKVHPTGFRIAYNKDWQSRWFVSDNKGFASNVLEDFRIRELIDKSYQHAFISKVEIEKKDSGNSLIINIFAEKPGYLIGKGGEEIENLISKLESETGKKVSINISEVKESDLDSSIVAKRIAVGIEKRQFFRKVMGDALQNAMEKGAKGIKVVISGRVGGAEMTRKYKLQEGNIPLNMLKADIDYAFTEAHTKFGSIGIKVWIHKGSTVKSEFQQTIRDQEIKEVV